MESGRLKQEEIITLSLCVDTFFIPIILLKNSSVLYNFLFSSRSSVELEAQKELRNES